MNSERYIIVLAGGIGTRFGSSLGKQYETIADKPILVWTVERYLDLFAIENIVVVINRNHLLLWKGLTNEYQHLKGIKTVIGGSQRFHSVRNALCEITCAENDLIGVHDGVRPFVSVTTIQRAYTTAALHGSGVPVFDSVNTLRIKNDNGNYAVDRATIKEVQNPQVFRASMIKKAYRQIYEASFLDDATVVEADGNKIYLCEGNYENIKITHPQDLYMAEGLIRFYHTDLSDNGTLRHNKRLSAI